MKKLIFKGAFFIILFVGLAHFTSCEKTFEFQEIEGDKITETPKTKDSNNQYYYAATGWVYNGAGECIGTYMREYVWYIEETANGPREVYGCKGHGGNCWPDFIIIGDVPVYDDPNDIIIPDKILSISGPEVNRVDSLYSKPLERAIRTSEEAVRLWVLQKGHRVINIPTPMMEGFKDGILTVKQFGSNRFSVYNGATDPTDAPVF